MTTALTTTVPNAGAYAHLPDETTDARLIEMWIARPRKTRSPHTRSRYGHVARKFLAAVQKPLQAVTLADLQAWVNALAGAPHSRKGDIAVIKSLFSFAYQTGYLRLNPATMIEVPTVPEAKKKRVVSEKDVIALIHQAGSPRNQALLQTLYSSGCRVSELCALTWDDVTPTREGRAELQIVGKGGKSRAAAISADTYQVLLAIRRKARDGDPVFRSQQGKAISRVQVHRIIKAAAARAGIHKPVSAHWFRHAHASHALARGATPAAVQEQLGHSSLAVTTGYAHASTGSADYLPI